MYYTLQRFYARIIWRDDVMARVVCSIWIKLPVYKFNMAEAAAPQDEKSTGTRQRGFRRAEEKKPSREF